MDLKEKINSMKIEEVIENISKNACFLGFSMLQYTGLKSR